MKKQFIIFLFSIFISETVPAQRTQFSLASDVSILRSFKKDQRYWAIGQTVHFHFHFTPTDGAYAWISYYSDGKFTNTLTADAKSSTVTPQQINYRNHAEMRFKHISLGWKRYLRGSSDSEKPWNLYGYAGLGLMIGHVMNSHSVTIDSSMYNIPVKSGTANFKRLTLDVGMGTEFHMGAGFYFYFEGRALVPTTDYPSPYLFINENAPFTATVNAGLRILFD